MHQVDLVERNLKLYNLSYKRNTLGSGLKQSSISAMRKGGPLLLSPAISPLSDLRKKKRKDDVILLYKEHFFGDVSPTQTNILYLPEP